MFDAAPPPTPTWELLPDCEASAEDCQLITAQKTLSSAAVIETSTQISFSNKPEIGQHSPQTPLPESKPKLLKLGSQGRAVMWVQQKLRSQGFDPGPADGVFGPKTRTALIMFQAKYDLNQDGVIGPATWKQLQHISQHQTSNTQPQSANIKDGIQSIPAF